MRANVRLEIIFRLQTGSTTLQIFLIRYLTIRAQSAPLLCINHLHIQEDPDRAWHQIQEAPFSCQQEVAKTFHLES